MINQRRLSLVCSAIAGFGVVLATVPAMAAPHANMRRLMELGRECPQCDLRNADLRGVDLNGANLRGADLRGADLRGADLQGMDCSGATYDQDTRFPDGFEPGRHGLVLAAHRPHPPEGDRGRAHRPLNLMVDEQEESATVPEPASLLGLIGLGGLAIVSLRRK